MSYPKAERGRLAADRLIQALAAERRPTERRTQTPFRLVVRETTAAPPGELPL